MQINKELSEMAKQIIILIFLSGGLLLGGCEKRQPPPQRPVPEVATVTVQPQQVALTTELPGRTSAYLIAEIRPQVNGLIQRRLFKEGSDVRAGQVLYQIDPSPFQATLDNAMATLGKANANLPAIRLRVERYRDLLADKAVSQQDFDDAAAAEKQVQAEIEYCKATVKSARINLGYTRITAPISGRIGKSNVTDGALVTAYQPMALTTIQQLDPIYVDVAQSTTDILRLRRLLKEGQLDQNGKNQQKVRLIMDDGTEYPMKGTLQFRDITVDPTTGSVILRVVFPNPKGILLPGMFVRALVQEGINKQAILIPQQAVSRNPKGDPLTLNVDAQGKVVQRQITLDRAIGNVWLVSSGITPGERVIVEGLLKIKPGVPVKAVPFKEDMQNSGKINYAAPPAKKN